MTVGCTRALNAADVGHLNIHKHSVTAVWHGLRTYGGLWASVGAVALDSDGIDPFAQ